MVKHTHKLKLRKMRNREEVYFCVKDCRYRVNRQEALGKLNECWSCGKDFHMNEYSIRRTKPKCPDCVRHEGDNESKIEDKIEEIKPKPTRSRASLATDDLRERLKTTISAVLASADDDDSDDLL